MTRGSNMIHYFLVFSLDESTELGSLPEDQCAEARVAIAVAQWPKTPSRSAEDAVTQWPSLSELEKPKSSSPLRCVAWSPKMPSRSGPRRRHAVAHDVVAQMAKLVGVATVNLPKSLL
ncbi:NBS-LRR protein [Sesbania bispinosa]|nr:NBS-LRR protein [Sesbania bispinosa]